MPEAHQCPNGHSWDANDNSGLSDSAFCPRCGSMAVTGDALPPSPENLLPIKSGHAGDSERPLPCIPGYEILEILGPGGMGVVFKARQIMPNRLRPMDESGAGC